MATFNELSRRLAREHENGPHAEPDAPQAAAKIALKDRGRKHTTHVHLDKIPQGHRMLKISRVKGLAAKVYSGILRSDSHYAFSVRQHRETSLRRELEEDPKLLTPHGWSGYSQNDEDVIIQEIFRRIGTATRRFVEFGEGDPLCNTGTYLLLSGWSGEWIDASGSEIESIRAQFRAWIESENLTVTQTFTLLRKISTAW